MIVASRAYQSEATAAIESAVASERPGAHREAHLAPTAACADEPGAVAPATSCRRRPTSMRRCPWQPGRNPTNAELLRQLEAVRPELAALTQAVERLAARQ